MAVKVGNSWVSETALTYARSKADSGASVTLKGLSERYPNINFSTNTQPFSQKGTNNIQIAPSILAQMQSNPEKRVEYEALIYDCAQLSYSGQINSNGHVKAAGTIINADGSVSGWSITQADVGNEVKHKTKLDKTKKDSWADKLLEKQKEKRAQEKRVDNLSISSAGQESYKQLSSVSYQGYVDLFESTLSELSASGNDDTSITNHFDYYANQMAASYDKMRSDIEAKYASDDYKPQYYIAESGRIEELTKDKELDMLKRAYESHSTLMASTTEIWESLKDFKPSTVYGNSSTGADETQTADTDKADAGAAQKGHIRDIAYKALISAIGSDNLKLSASHTGSLNKLNLNLDISASDRSLLNSIWNYYAK